MVLIVESIRIISLHVNDAANDAVNERNPQVMQDLLTRLNPESARKTRKR